MRRKQNISIVDFLVQFLLPLELNLIEIYNKWNHWKLHKKEVPVSAVSDCKSSRVDVFAM